MITTEQIIIAFLLTLVAGIATGVGALLSLFANRNDTRWLSVTMGLSAGVMVFVSLVELLPSAMESLGKGWAMLAFAGGIGLAALIDRLVPEDENPHEMRLISDVNPGKLKRSGVMLALAIGIHNFPEGIATFVSALDSLDVALPIVVAIAIHNIPEGIAISVPIYHATGRRRKAFVYSLLSGLAEPVGALVGMAVLLPLWSAEVSQVCFAAVAGIMVYISFDELLPGSERYGHHHLALGGVIAGMAIMAVALIIL